MNEVVSVFPSKNLNLQTTTSWNFMGLKEGKRTKRNPLIESDTIIGVIDSGIYPESDSFSGKGFGPPPKKWKGVCKVGTNFTCNKYKTLQSYNTGVRICHFVVEMNVNDLFVVYQQAYWSTVLHTQTRGVS